MFDQDYTEIFERESKLRALYALPSNDINRPDLKNTLHKLIRVNCGEFLKTPKLKRLFTSVFNLRYSISPLHFDKFIPFKFRHKLIRAGGSVTSDLIGTDYSDIDLFIVDPNPTQLLEEYLTWIKPHIDERFKRTKNTIEFSILGWFKVQIILRQYTSVSEIITGFDVDVCCCAKVGEAYYTTERGYRALLHKTNVVNIALLSSSYENRLAKYLERGVSVQMPIGTPTEAFKLYYNPEYKHNSTRIISKHNLGYLVYKLTSLRVNKADSNYRDVFRIENKVFQHFSMNLETMVKNLTKEVIIDGTKVDKITFITLNPGQQNNSWSFEPVVITWDDYMKSDVVQRPRRIGMTEEQKEYVKTHFVNGEELTIEFPNDNIPKQTIVYLDSRVKTGYYNLNNFASPVSSSNKEPRKDIRGRYNFSLKKNGDIVCYSSEQNTYFKWDMEKRLCSSVFLEWKEYGSFFSDIKCPYEKCACIVTHCHAKCTKGNCVTCDPKYMTKFPKHMYIKYLFDFKT